MPDCEIPDYEFFLNISKLSDLGLSELKGNNASHPQKKFKTLNFSVRKPVENEGLVRS